MAFSENQRTLSTGSFHVLWIPKEAHPTSSACCMRFKRAELESRWDLIFIKKHHLSPPPVLLLLWILLLAIKPITQIRKLQEPEFQVMF